MHNTRFLIVIVIDLLLEQGIAAAYDCDPSAQCGCSKSPITVDRIVGGIVSNQDSWPWAVSLRQNGEHFCGASIISSSFTITASQCVDQLTSFENVTILAGSLTLGPELPDSYQIRSIAEVYSYPNYSDVTSVNDITLIRLSSPFNFVDTTLKPICLPSGNILQPPDDIDVIAVGWGTTSSSHTTNSVLLQQVTLKSLSSTSSPCQNMISNSDTQFCAGFIEGGKGNNDKLNEHTKRSFSFLGTCFGDSGGPLMAFVNNVWEIDGITSYIPGCGDVNFPGIFTRVSHYKDWITSVLSLDKYVTNVDIMIAGSTTQIPETSVTETLESIPSVIAVGPTSKIPDTSAIDTMTSTPDVSMASSTTRIPGTSVIDTMTSTPDVSVAGSTSRITDTSVTDTTASTLDVSVVSSTTRIPDTSMNGTTTIIPGTSVTETTHTSDSSTKTSVVTNDTPNANISVTDVGQTTTSIPTVGPTYSAVSNSMPSTNTTTEGSTMSTTLPTEITSAPNSTVRENSTTTSTTINESSTITETVIINNVPTVSQTTTERKITTVITYSEKVTITTTIINGEPVTVTSTTTQRSMTTTN